MLRSYEFATPSEIFPGRGEPAPGVRRGCAARITNVYAVYFDAATPHQYGPINCHLEPSESINTTDHVTRGIMVTS